MEKTPTDYLSMNTSKCNIILRYTNVRREGSKWEGTEAYCSTCRWRGKVGFQGQIQFLSKGQTQETYHDVMNSEHYLEWFTGKVLPTYNLTQ